MQKPLIESFKTRIQRQQHHHHHLLLHPQDQPRQHHQQPYQKHKSSRQRGHGRAGYDYDLQASHDHGGDEGHAAEGVGGRTKRRPKVPNYKPKALTWPFIAVVIALLCLAIALLVYADKAMPNSDSDAVIIGANPTVTPGQVQARNYHVLLGRADLNTSSISLSIPDRTHPADVNTKPKDDTSETTPSPILTTFPVPTTTSAGSTMTPGDEDDAISSTGTDDLDIGKIDPEGPRTTTDISENVVIPVSTSLSYYTNHTTIKPTITFVTSTSISISVTKITQETVIVITVSPSGSTALPPPPLSTPTRSIFPTFFPNGTWTPSSWPSSPPPASTPSSASDNDQGTGVGATRTPTVGYGSLSTITKTTIMESTLTQSTVVTIPQSLAGTVVPEVGTVTIIYYTTLPPDDDDKPGPGKSDKTQPLPNKPEGDPKTKDSPKEHTRIVVDPETVIPIVVTQDPDSDPDRVIKVVPTNVVGVETGVITPPISVGVTEVGGTVVTNIVVITPSPQQQRPGAGITNDVVSTVGGTPVTIVNQPDAVIIVTTGADGTVRTVVETPAPETIVSLEGGTLTTVAVDQPAVHQTLVTTDANGNTIAAVFTANPTNGDGATVGQPVTYTVVRTGANGELTTDVLVTTMTPPTMATGFNGQPITYSITTIIDGTLMTQTFITTPTGTEPITLTFISTSGASFSTFTRTFSPTTFETTISGVLTTITSTPSPRLTTSFSTRSRKTRSLISTESSSSSQPPSSTHNPEDNDDDDDNNNGRTRIIAGTKVYSWTEADIFLGTFLPALFGVALVIPLRIIDLNAKLYQPFQSLASLGGATGAETLNMQYSGVASFLYTPIVTLLEGHPIPFLTTMVVSLASFLVPLATEAIGLKLHGFCYLNTASSQCGPQLGVSASPAYALMALIVVLILLLLLVLFFIRDWRTGVWANPWNIAGIASLVASNPSVQIRGNFGRGGAGSNDSSEEATMRAMVAQRRYGLGYYRTPAGEEEYGIILTDESGQGLHGEQQQAQDHLQAEGHEDVDFFEGEEGTGKKGGWVGMLRRGPDPAARRRKTLHPFMTLRAPWRIALILLQLAVLIFIIYYHAYYYHAYFAGKAHDRGRLWGALNSNAFGVRFISAAIGVIIAVCWQSFFISKCCSSCCIPSSLLQKTASGRSS